MKRHGKVRVYPVEIREYLNDRLVFSNVVACFSSYVAAYEFTNSEECQRSLTINEPGYTRRPFIYHNGYALDAKEVE